MSIQHVVYFVESIFFRFFRCFLSEVTRISFEVLHSNVKRKYSLKAKLRLDFMKMIWFFFNLLLKSSNITNIREFVKVYISRFSPMRLLKKNLLQKLSHFITNMFYQLILISIMAQYLCKRSRSRFWFIKFEPEPGSFLTWWSC